MERYVPCTCEILTDFLLALQLGFILRILKKRLGVFPPQTEVERRSIDGTVRSII